MEDKLELYLKTRQEIYDKLANIVQDMLDNLSPSESSCDENIHVNSEAEPPKEEQPTNKTALEESAKPDISEVAKSIIKKLTETDDDDSSNSEEANEKGHEDLDSAFTILSIGNSDDDSLSIGHYGDDEESTSAELDESSSDQQYTLDRSTKKLRKRSHHHIKKYRKPKRPTLTDYIFDKIAENHAVKIFFSAPAENIAAMSDDECEEAFRHLRDLISITEQLYCDKNWQWIRDTEMTSS